MLLYVIRHADPIYDPDSLTEKGKRQAEALGRRLSVHGLDRIYCSPLQRAQDTARPTCELLGIKPEILEWASEAVAGEYFGFFDQKNGGKWNWCFGVHPAIFKNEETLALGDRWYEAEPFCYAKAKEGYELIGRESDKFLESLGYKRNGLHYDIIKPSDERVAVFCHYGLGTTWLSHLLGINPLVFWANFNLNHSGVTIIQFKNRSNGKTVPLVLSLSDNSHIYGDRLPMQYTNEIDI